MCDETDEALVEATMPILEIDHQYIRSAEGWNQDLVAQIRRCGRAAARRLGYRVRTMATDPAERDDGRAVVIVVVTSSNSVDEERLRARGDLLMLDTIRKALYS